MPNAPQNIRTDTAALIQTSLEAAAKLRVLHGDRLYICPVGRDANAYHPYNSHHRAFWVTQQERYDAEGLVLCEFCESECIPVDAPSA